MKTHDITIYVAVAKYHDLYITEFKGRYFLRGYAFEPSENTLSCMAENIGIERSEIRVLRWTIKENQKDLCSIEQVNCLYA